jgi:hypothetical protein
MIREFDNDRWNGYPYMTNERVREKCLEICRSSSERKSMESKPRILYLQKILLERTDEENMLSTTQLINILNDEYGISAHRDYHNKGYCGSSGVWNGYCCYSFHSK